MRKYFIILVICLMSHSSYIVAMPLDSFLSAIPQIDKSRQKLQFESGYDFTTDTVDYSPNTSNGDHKSPVAVKRYEGGHIGGAFQLNSRWLFEGMYWQRKIVSMRDKYDLQSLQAAIQYTLPNTILGNRFAVRAGLWTNYSDVLDKNSYTRFQDYLLTSAQIHNPQDFQQQLNLISSRSFASNWQASFFVGAGQSTVSVDWLEGNLQTKNGCNYHVALLDDSGTINQVGSCGEITRMTMKLPTKQAVINNVGSDPNQDLEYDASFWQLGANLAWTRNNWHARLGYYYQSVDRGALDDRVKELGYVGFNENHTLSSDVIYQFSNHFGLYARAEYMSNRLINTVPFIYNTYTSEKFGKEGILFSAGATFFL